MEVKKFCKILKKIQNNKKIIQEDELVRMMNSVLKNKNVFENIIDINKKTKGQIKLKHIKYVDDGKDDIHINVNGKNLFTISDDINNNQQE